MNKELLNDIIGGICLGLLMWLVPIVILILF